MVEPELLGLLERCYAAITEPDGWKDFVANTKRAFDAPIMTLTTFRLRPVRFDWHILDGVAEQFVQEVLEWVPRDPRSEYTLRTIGAGEACTWDDSFDVEAFKRSDYFIHGESKLDALWAAVALLGEARDLQGLMVASRPERMAPFDQRDVHHLAVLSRHVGRALQLRLDLERACAQTALHRDLLDRLPIGLCFPDARGRVVGVNRPARALLDRGDGLRFAAGLLEATEPGARRQLGLAVAAAGKGLLDGVGGVVAVARPSSRPDLVVSVDRCFSDLGRLLGAQAAVVVSIADPAREAPTTAATLRSLWNLTAAEAQVALALAVGDRLPEIARRNGISPATVKVHLKHALAKSGAHRQSDLVRMILAGPGSGVVGR